MIINFIKNFIKIAFMKIDVIKIINIKIDVIKIMVIKVEVMKIVVIKIDVIKIDIIKIDLIKKKSCNHVIKIQVKVASFNEALSSSENTS